MSAQLGTCGCTDIPKTTTPGTALDASETAAKCADKTFYTFVGTPANPKFPTFAEKYAWMKGRAACTNQTLCLNTSS